MTGTLAARPSPPSADRGVPRELDDLGVQLVVDLATFGSGEIHAGRIDTPVSGTRSDSCLVHFSGWLLGEDGPVTAVEIRHAGVVLDRIPVDFERKDIPAQYPDRAWADRCGFAGRIEVFKLPPSFRLELSAVFSDERSAPIGKIEGEWTPPASASEEHLQPIMLTTLGRSGSTWVTRLLGRHPSVVTYAPFRCEPRAASYWLEMYGALAGSGSYHQILHGELYGPDWLAGTRRSRARAPEDPIEAWLAHQHVRTLLPQALEQIEAFSRAAADLEGKGAHVSHFAEKFGLNTFVQPLIHGLYPRAREIILVRDPRDMICSMLAYNRKRGHSGFGRDQVQTDAEYVHWWRWGLQRMLTEWSARSKNAVLLRYEDLIREPEPTLSRLFDYLGLDHDAGLTKRVLEDASGIRPDVQKQHQTAADPAASIGRWREDFTPTMTEAADEAFSDILESFGYAP